MWVEACGCGHHPEQAQPWDENEMVWIDGDSAHCPTVCWVGDHIIRLLHAHVFVHEDHHYDGGHHDDGSTHTSHTSGTTV